MTDTASASYQQAPRHILSLSGGKDSAALAIYMRDRVPDMEYIFHDTDKELPETYDYLSRLRSDLGKTDRQNLANRHLRSLVSRIWRNAALQSPPLVHANA